MVEITSSDKIGLQLHDRATRGNVLNAAEQTQLQLWYAAQDEEEAKQLHTIPNLTTLLQANQQYKLIIEMQWQLLQEQQQLLKLFSRKNE